MAFKFETVDDIEGVDREAWNRLASKAGPMMEWEYFHALEKSGTVSRQKGYLTRHLVLYRGDRLVAVAPLYERDRAWVEFGDGGLIEFLTEMTGYPYRQGLVGALPFTPIPAYRFLVDPAEEDPPEIHRFLLDRIDDFCLSRGLFTSRIYFVDAESYHLHTNLVHHGYVCIRSEHYLWRNHDYHEFADFLKTFKSSRRTKIKRELRELHRGGVRIRMTPGEEAPRESFERMYDRYLDTWVRYMGPNIRAFLNEDFFLSLEREFRHRVCFSMADLAGENVGMALFYRKDGRLFGRYWGSDRPVPFLHFATCYYHPIEYAIEKGMRSMDPGFGGEHKLYRGFEVIPVFHYIKFYGGKQRRVAYSILEQMKSRSSIVDSFKGRP